MDFFNTNINLERSITSYAKMQMLISSMIRNRKMFADLKGAGCYVDIGCGPNIDKSFCNIDYMWRPGINICWDVARGLPFPDGYVSGIFTEHMLEHIPFESAIFVLKECRRVIQDKGVLRIVMPDGELYLKTYCFGDSAIMPYADGDSKRFSLVTPIVSINRIFREHGHQFIWDFETLREALFRAGFQMVEKCSFRNGRDNVLLRDTPDREIESFYTEAF